MSSDEVDRCNISRATYGASQAAWTGVAPSENGVVPAHDRGQSPTPFDFANKSG